MSTGQVKWFNNAKGFGFILPDDGEKDLFAHYSSIAMEGYRTLKAGQLVSFDIVEGPKGLHAANIMPLDNADTPQQPDETQDNAEKTVSPSTETKEPSEVSIETANDKSLDTEEVPSTEDDNNGPADTEETHDSEDEIDKGVDP